jgi:hypothetical protein
MRQNRRMFLGALGAGIAFLSLPEISPVLGILNPSGVPDDNLADTIHRLLLGEGSGGPFIARAETTMIEGVPQPLYDAPTALLKMLDSHGFDRRFSANPNNDEADQCAGEFEAREDSWRRQGFNAFSKIHRSKVDNHVAIGVGGNIDDNSNLTKASGATQYQNMPAVDLVGHDAAVTMATKWLLDKNLSGKELAQVLALTEKRNVAMESGQLTTRYETPVSAGVYIPQPRQSSRVRNAVGVIAANLKKEPNYIYFTDVYA